MPADPSPPRSGDLSGAVLGALLRDAYLRRSTGVLSLEQGPDRRERLFFVGGELYCAPDHPLAVELSGEPSAATEATVEHLLAWSTGRFELSSDARGIPVDLVGPVALPAVVMEVAVRGRGRRELLAELGGERRLWVAPGAAEMLARLTEHESEHDRLLMRLAEPTTVRQVLSTSSEEPIGLLRNLCRLRAVGLIREAGEAPDDGADRLLTGELLRRFMGRIAEELERRPLTLSVDEHRRRLAEALSRLGEVSHFELLGVETDAPREKIHDAYVELARLAHPAHGSRLGLGEPPVALELLFERATLAYLILGDDGRRAAYRRELVGRGAAAGGAPDDRAGEERELARDNFRLARRRADAGDYYAAIELLWQAVRIDPRPEYYKLLGVCQHHNPNWRKKAILSYSQALELEPGDHEARLALAALYAEDGNRAAARREYTAVLDEAPDDRRARKGLDRLRRGVSAAGLLESLGKRFRG